MFGGSIRRYNERRGGGSSFLGLRSSSFVFLADPSAVEQISKGIFSERGGLRRKVSLYITFLNSNNSNCDQF